MEHSLLENKDNNLFTFSISRKRAKRLLIHGLFISVCIALSIASNYIKELDHINSWIVGVGTYALLAADKISKE